MRRRVPLAIVAMALAAAVVPPTVAEAACRPRLLADLGPAPAHQPEPAPPLPYAPTLQPDEAETATTTTVPATTTTVPGTTTTVPGTTTTTPTAAPTSTTLPGEAPDGGEPAVSSPSTTTTTTTSPAVRTTPPPPSCRFVYRLEFPVLGGGQIGSVFGDIREGGERWHAGVDVFAPKLTPVVAARSGTVSAVHDTPGDCCWLSLRHDDGWQTFYIHLNNDTPGTDDGRGVGIRPGLEVGARLEQGEVLGWVGDSGNAETAVPHVHFELRTRWGQAVDPGPSLWSSLRRPASATGGGEERRPSFAGAFLDDDGHRLEPSLDWGTALGMSLECDTWGIRQCPNGTATRMDAVEWIVEIRRGLLDSPEDSERTRAALVAASGCADPVACSQPLRRAELAALVLVSGDPLAPFDPGGALARLHSEGRTDSCSPSGVPVDEPMSRSGTVHMLLRSFGYLGALPCDLIS